MPRVGIVHGCLCDCHGGMPAGLNCGRCDRRHAPPHRAIDAPVIVTQRRMRKWI